MDRIFLNFLNFPNFLKMVGSGPFPDKSTYVDA